MVKIIFYHDYATDVQNKRKEYTPVKKALKERGIRFQTPPTRMRVFRATGTIMYNTATHAAEDLRKRGFTVGEVTRGTKSAGVTEETLDQLLPWENTETRCGRDKDRYRYQRQIREKLREYRRTESGPAEEDG